MPKMYSAGKAQEDVSDKAKIDALWKKIMEGDDKTADDLKVKADKIKTKVKDK